MKKNIILIGGGGHCRSCIDVIESTNDYTIKGIIDTIENKGKYTLGCPLMAIDDDLPSLTKKYRFFLVTLGQIKTAVKRKKLFTSVKKLGAVLPAIVSPLARVSPHATIGEGTIVMHYALVNSAGRVGDDCIINTRAIIEHDCLVGDHCHISTGAIVNGGAKVGEECFIGSGAVLREGVSVHRRCIVAAGAIVSKSITEAGTYAGNPARRIR